MGTAGSFYLILICMISVLFILTVVNAVVLVIVFQRREIYKNKIKEAETYAANIKNQTDMKYKKLIQLTPKELDEYFGLIFGYFLELNSEARVSEKDPDATTKLYANTLSSMLEYIGEETISALDYYYGTGYVEKWCQLRYMLLENRRIMSKIINKTYDYAAVQNNITEGQ